MKKQRRKDAGRQAGKEGYTEWCHVVWIAWTRVYAKYPRCAPFILSTPADGTVVSFGYALKIPMRVFTMHARPYSTPGVSVLRRLHRPNRQNVCTIAGQLKPSYTCGYNRSTIYTLPTHNLSYSLLWNRLSK